MVLHMLGKHFPAQLIWLLRVIRPQGEWGNGLPQTCNKVTAGCLSLGLLGTEKPFSNPCSIWHPVSKLLFYHCSLLTAWSETISQPTGKKDALVWDWREKSQQLRAPVAEDPSSDLNTTSIGSQNTEMARNHTTPRLTT